jgi:hypothetical protein
MASAQPFLEMVVVETNPHALLVNIMIFRKYA